MMMIILNRNYIYILSSRMMSLVNSYDEVHHETSHLTKLNARFRFTTFGFPIEAQITEYVPSVDGRTARDAGLASV